jgi:ATP/maltotriose-dependent transcriptional regulator MalT
MEVIMSVNTTIGHPARGDEYFDRPQLTDRLWEKIQSGSSILLAAPRRVGKSSVLFYLMDNPKNNYRPTYIDTESVNNENEFFKRLFNLVINTLSKMKVNGKWFIFYKAIVPSVRCRKSMKKYSLSLPVPSVWKM